MKNLKLKGVEILDTTAALKIKGGGKWKNNGKGDGVCINPINGGTPPPISYNDPIGCPIFGKLKP